MITVVWKKSRRVNKISLNVIIFSRLSLLSPWHVHINFRISQIFHMKCWDIDWCFVESKSRITDILLLTLEICEHGIFLHLLGQLFLIYEVGHMALSVFNMVNYYYSFSNVKLAFSSFLLRYNWQIPLF